VAETHLKPKEGQNTSPEGKAGEKKNAIDFPPVTSEQ